MNAYRVVEASLAAAQDRFPIVGRDIGVTGITVMALSPGATFSLHVGAREGIPITREGVELHNLCPAEINGIFISNAAQPGQTVTFFVSFGGGQLTVEP